MPFCWLTLKMIQTTKARTDSSRELGLHRGLPCGREEPEPLTPQGLPPGVYMSGQLE